MRRVMKNDIQQNHGKRWFLWVNVAGMLAVLAAGLSALSNAGPSNERPISGDRNASAVAEARRLVLEGRRIFRYDTFGSEAFWGDALRLHEAVATMDPATALAVGLKVDAEALPSSVIEAIREGTIDLNDPDTTLALLELDAVVGVEGFFDEEGELSSMGIRCSLCHSVVDDSVVPGIGERLDGWANRDLDVGTIISLAPNLEPFADLLGVDEDTVRTVLRSWGPGRFDAALLLDGKAFRPDGKPAATLIPPAFGLAGVNLHTFTGWGGIGHWNALVANLEMGGQGTFVDARLDDAVRFPVAAGAGFANVRAENDRVTAKLPALHLYQLALTAPGPPPGSFDAEAAARGGDLFRTKAECASCHVPPLFTEPGWNAHTPDEIGIDSFQAERSPDGVYRTTPLGGLWTHTRGGFYHDGRFATLRDVVDHYDDTFALGLTDDEKDDLVQYLLSL